MKQQGSKTLLHRWNKPEVKYLHQCAVIFFHKQKEQIYEKITSKNLPC